MSDSITFQTCNACGHLQYFARAFCAACGANNPLTRTASGAGVVYATSLVHRAATPETRAEVPYMIVLVDAAEGFRMMAHGDKSLTIGDRVVATARDFAGHRVPYFQRTSS
ncbi:MAG: hypothetical protein JWR73_397 [Tardiphaga sp.]|nr:hypothetical protein [Tardiphaga sp.]